MTTLREALTSFAHWLQDNHHWDVENTETFPIDELIDHYFARAETSERGTTKEKTPPPEMTVPPVDRVNFVENPSMEIGDQWVLPPLEWTYEPQWEFPKPASRIPCPDAHGVFGKLTCPYVTVKVNKSNNVTTKISCLQKFWSIADYKLHYFEEHL